jgi:hypothetical protein
MQLLTEPARAYVYAGDWVADCPQAGCGNTEHLFDRTNRRDPNSPRTVPKSRFVCSNCQVSTPIAWSQDMAEITAVLALRPIPQTRNWYPRDHDIALRFRIPHGQSVDDLREENAEHGVPTR